MNRILKSVCLLAVSAIFSAATAQTYRLIPASGIQGQVGVGLTAQLLVLPSGSYLFSGDLSAYGLTLSSSGLVSGTPIVATTGTALVPIQIQNSVSTETPPQTVNLGITISPPALSITTASVPNGVSTKGFLTPTTLSATGGTPPYTWSVSNGSLNGLTLNTDGTFSGTFNTTASPQTVTFTAQVSDSNSSTYRLQYTFTLYPLLQITSPTSLGVAVAGRAISSITPTTSGAVGTLTWSISNLPANLVFSASTGTIGGTPLAAGNSNVTLQVQDATSGQSATRTASLTTYAPLSYSGPTALGPAVLGQAFSQVQVSATGGAGPYTYSQTGLPSGITLDASTGIIRGTPNGTAGASSVSLSVSDPTTSQTAGTTQPLNLQVYSQLQLSAPASLTPGVTGQTYSLNTFSATGGSGTYSWSATGLPTGITISASTGLISGTTASTSTNNVVVTVRDTASGQSASSSALALNFYAPLTLTGPGTMPNAIIGRSYGPATFTVGGGSGAVTWSLTGPNYGLSISNAGQVTGTISGAAGPASITVAIQDSTAGQTKSQSFPFTIYTYPSVTGPSSLPAGISGRLYSGANAAGTGGSGSYAWSQVGLPAGLSIDPNSGAIAGSVNGAASGTSPVSITLTDKVLAVTASRSLSLQVYPVLSITGPGTLPTSTFGTNYPATTIQPSGGSGFYTWSAAGLPGGMAISSGGVISGSPNAGGTFTVVVTVSDPISNQFVTQNYSLVINYAPLTVTSRTSLGIVGQNTTVSANLTATGGLPSYTWRATGSLPSGLTLTPGGLLSGTALIPGNYIFGVSVSDSQPQAATVSTSVNLGVVGFTSPSNLPGASTTATYAYTFGATGGNGVYQFTSPSGLPAGLALSSTGVLSGQPKTPGTPSFAVMVSDSSGAQTTSTFSLVVAAATPLKITTGSPLTSGSANIPYAINLTATGGNPPYTWAVTSGTLPEGLTLTAAGNLSGTPSKAGTFNFTVTATDGSGGSASAPMSVLIAAAQLQLTSGSLPSGVANIDYPKQMFTATGGTGTSTFSVTAGTLPPGLTLTADGILSGTPTTASPDNSPFGFTVTATDQANVTVSGTFTLAIRPSGTTDLILSSSSLSFNLVAGTATLPDPQNITLKSSSLTAAAINYSVTAPSASWLAVNTGSGSTPSSLQFSLTPAALTLKSSPTAVTVQVMCLTAPCTGKSQAVVVSLGVTNLAPQLSVLTDRLSFGTDSARPQSATQNIQLRNSGGGTIAITSAVCNATWCSAGASSGSVGAGATTTIPVTANPSGLTAGYYRTTVDLVTSAGTASVPVTLLLAADSTILLAPSGSLFSMPAGGQPGNPKGSFLITSSGQGSISWTATVQPGASWLQLIDTSGTASAPSPAPVRFSISSTASLSPQTYYGTIRVTTPGATTPTVDYQVVLNVLAANAPVNPDPQPAGLIFITSAGSAPPPQTVSVYAGTGNAGTVLYSSSASTNSGGNWLSVANATGSTTAGTPDLSTVTVNPTGLAPGVYTGGISYSITASGVRTINVTLIVQAVLTTPATELTSKLKPLANGSCAPTTLAPTQTGLVNNFSAPTSWPTPLAVRLFNDCGAAVTNGQITVTFSNGDPPLAMPLVDSNTALYSATWTPRNSSSQVAVTARAQAPGLLAASAQIVGAVTPNKAPILARNGTLHIFYPQVGAALAPGNVVQIYGSNLSGQTVTPSTLPLPTTAGGTSVIIGGIETPLFYVGPTQIDAMVPYELTPGKQYQIIVSANGALTTPDSITLSGTAPGLAAFADGTIIAQHGDGSLVTPTSPAAPGEYLVLYSSGFGVTDNKVTTGAASPANPLARPVSPVTVTIDGAPATVAFAGLTPGLVGLYQVNFQVPANAKSGALPLLVNQNGSSSNPTTLPVAK